MRRVSAWRHATAAALVGAALIAAPSQAAAMSGVRLHLAGQLAAMNGALVGGTDPVLGLVVHSYQNAGVDTTGLDTADHLLDGADKLNVTDPEPRGPAPGDLAVYTTAQELPGPIAGSVAHLRRTAIFVSSNRLLVANPATGQLEVRLRADLDGVAARPGEPPIAEAGTVFAVRLAAWRWPGGHDDVSIAPGTIALTDPGVVAADLDWAASHPRDVDFSFGHQFAMAVASLLQVLAVGFTTLLGWILNALFGSEGLAAIAAGLVWLLSRTANLTGLHAVLTVLVLALALLVAPHFFLPLLLIMVGAATLDWLGVPVLGGIGHFITTTVWRVAGFVVTILTGVEADRPSSLFAIGIAVLSLPMAWLRPLLALAPLRGVVQIGTLGWSRLAAPLLRFGIGHDFGIGGRAITALWSMCRNGVGHVVRTVAVGEHSAVGVTATAADALALKPRAVRALALPLLDHFPGYRRPLAELGSAVDRTVVQGRRALLWRGFDGISLLWRPHALVGDLLAHTADAAHEIDLSMRAGIHGWPFNRLRTWLLGLNPARRQSILNAAAHLSVHQVPALRKFAELGHLQGGAATITSIAQGHLPGLDVSNVAASVGAPTGTSTPPAPAPPRPGPASKPSGVNGY